MLLFTTEPGMVINGHETNYWLALNESEIGYIEFDQNELSIDVTVGETTNTFVFTNADMAKHIFNTLTNVRVFDVEC